MTVGVGLITIVPGMLMHLGTYAGEVGSDICIYIYIYTYIDIFIYTYIYVYMSDNIVIHMCIGIDSCTSQYIDEVIEYIYVYSYVCVYVHIYML